MVVKISTYGITIQEYNNFYWDGEDGEGMTLSMTKKLICSINSQSFRYQYPCWHSHTWNVNGKPSVPRY